MQIFVKKPQGNTTTLYVESNETILTIKSKLREEEGICSDMHLVLIYNGTHLEDGHTLAHYDISKESTLRLFLTQTARQEKPGITLNVKRKDSIDDMKSKIQEEKGIPSHKLLLFHRGKWLEDGSLTLAHYNIYNSVSLKLAIQLEQGPQSAAASDITPRQTKRSRPETPTEATSVSDTICQVEAEFKKNKQELTIARNKEKGLEAAIYELKAGNKKTEEELRVARNKEKELEATVSGLKVENKKNEEIARNKEKELEATISRLKAGNKKIEEIAENKEKELEATVSGLKAESKKNEEIARNKEKELEATVSRLKAESKKSEEIARNKEKELEATISSLKAENRKNEQALTINARNKEMGLEATISGLKAGNKKTEEELTITRNKEKELEATISELKAENRKIEEIARNKEKELEATISSLKAENRKIKEIAQHKEKELDATVSGLKVENRKNEEIARNKEKELENTISELKAENKKTEEELTILRYNENGLESSISNNKTEAELTLARNKEKELEATISGLRHKNKLFSDQCDSYESLVDDLEVENKKTKEELMNAEKKYYAGARAAGYAEGLKEGKAKRLKSVEFLHRLTDASMRYFNYGFDSCQKQAEQQGFRGQLNKDSALKDVPDLKG